MANKANTSSLVQQKADLLFKFEHFLRTYFVYADGTDAEESTISDFHKYMGC